MLNARPTTLKHWKDKNHIELDAVKLTQTWLPWFS